MLGTSGHVVTLHMFVYKCSPVQLKYLFETMLSLSLVKKNMLKLSDLTLPEKTRTPTVR